MGLQKKKKKKIYIPLVVICPTASLTKDDCVRVGHIPCTLPTGRTVIEGYHDFDYETKEYGYGPRYKK
jgi:hypothetical protein